MCIPRLTRTHLHLITCLMTMMRMTRKSFYPQNAFRLNVMEPDRWRIILSDVCLYFLFIYTHSYTTLYLHKYFAEMAAWAVENEFYDTDIYLPS